MLFAIVAMFMVLALGGAGFAFAGAARDRSAEAPRRGRQAARRSCRGVKAARQHRAQAQERPGSCSRRSKARQAEQKQKLTMRRRLEQAGFADVTPRTFWIVSGGVRPRRAGLCFFCRPGASGRDAFAAFAAGLGLPRWVLGFLKRRREKKFTARIRQRHRRHRAQRAVGPSDQRGAAHRRARNPRSRRQRIQPPVEGLKVGVTLEQGCKRMYREHADAGSELLRHRHDDPAEVGRQSLRGAEQSRRRAARPQAPAGQDQGDVVGSQGVGQHHRLAAAGA